MIVIVTYVTLGFCKWKSIALIVLVPRELISNQIIKLLGPKSVRFPADAASVVLVHCPVRPISSISIDEGFNGGRTQTPPGSSSDCVDGSVGLHSAKLQR